MSLGYSEALDVREGVDTALDEHALVEAYMAVFGALRVSVRIAALSGSTAFTSSLALGLASSLAASIPLTRAMGRGTAPDRARRTACEPHLTLTLTSEASIPDRRSEDALVARVVAGSPLSSLDKAVLLALPCLRRRTALAVAWVANRCRQSMDASLAALPLLFRPLGSGPGGTLHANLLSLRLQKDLTIVEVFEPNGPDAYMTGGLGGLLEGLPSVIAAAGLTPEPVVVRSVGRGIQTALGEWTFSASTLQERGYPVCSAVCVWAFSKFVDSGTESLEQFDQELFAELTSSATARHRLQLEFFRYVQALRQWNDSEGTGELESALASHFRGTNVQKLVVGRGSSDRAAVSVSL